MDSVSIHDAKTHFSKLVHRTEAGESIVISRDGEPVAMLIPYRSSEGQKRKLGILKDRMKIEIDEEKWKMTDEELAGR